MRVLVHPDNLEIGGSPINAIDLAGAIREQGHQAIVYATPGPLAQAVADRRLRLIPVAGEQSGQLSIQAARRLRAIVRDERIDLVHTYEFRTCIHAFLGPHLRDGVPFVSTVMSMHVPPYFPRTMPLTVGTRAMVEAARAGRPGPVHLLEPPLDTTQEVAEPWAAPAFRQTYGISGSDLMIVVVSRLARFMKLEGLLRTLDAVDILAATHLVRLVVVGDGSAAATIREHADAINTRHGRPVVVLTGELDDPRPAYAAADLVVGMGSSAIRALAAGRPTVVVGELGFSAVVAPETFDHFDREGFYGRGNGSADGRLLVAQLEPLLVDPVLRSRLGQFGCMLARRRYDLAGAAARLVDIYAAAIAMPPRRAVFEDAVRTVAALSGYRARGRLDRVARWARRTG